MKTTTALVILLLSFVCVNSLDDCFTGPCWGTCRTQNCTLSDCYRNICICFYCNNGPWIRFLTRV